MEHINGVKYETIAGKSHQERKIVGWCANILVLFIIVFTFCNIFKPYYTIDVAPPTYTRIGKGKVVCESTAFLSKSCNANGDIRVMRKSSSIFVVSNAYTNSSWDVKPYVQVAASNVGNLRIEEVHHSHHQQIRHCTKHYNVPAIVFSTGGYAGILYRDFTDILIPLYLTSHEFEGEVQFLVTDSNPKWIEKYKGMLQRLSRYEIIYLDRETDEYTKDVFCFSRMIVGLKANKDFSFNTVSSTTSGNAPLFSMRNFTAFLRSTYGLKREVATKLDTSTGNNKPAPRLLLVSRNKTRRFMNTDEIASAARGVGFEVVVHEFKKVSNIEKVSKLVNEFDVMLGVHGAGLTNMVFLPENAIVIQVIGLSMETVARNCFELPSLDMGLRYIGYKAGVKERVYKEQDPIVSRNYSNLSPKLKTWVDFKEKFMEHQDIKLDIIRFRKTLINALELLYA